MIFNGALETVKEFTEESLAAAVIVKHTNPCGVALAETTAEAFLNARMGEISIPQPSVVFWLLTAPARTRRPRRRSLDRTPFSKQS